MTAEICILNKNGVALAADSAITVGRGNNKKIFNNVNKIFRLNRSIGVMIYGSNNYLGLPWEVIIKTFKHKIRDKKFNTVKEASDFFEKFLSKKRFRNADAEKKLNLSILENFLLNKFIDTKEIEDTLFEYLSENIHLHTFNEKINRQLKDFLSCHLKVQPTKYDEKNKNAICNQLINELLEFISSKINDFTISSENVLLLKEFITHTISSHNEILYDYRTGIVICGYGDKELLPISNELIVTGSVLLKPRISRGKHIVVSNNYPEIDNHNHTSEAAILPFAQSEMMDLFMTGIDTTFKDFILYNLKLTLDNNITDLLSTMFKNILSNKSTTFFEPLINEMRKELTNITLLEMKEKLNEYSYRHHQEPILDVVSILPKEELANMAETLINLTSFKRKVTLEEESVGGPIDVALITKGEGFVWIKHKHYFNQNLNKHHT